MLPIQKLKRSRGVTHGYTDNFIKLCCPTKVGPTAEWHNHIEACLNRYYDGYHNGVKFCYGRSVVDARQELIEEAVWEGVRYILFIDDDIFPPPYFIPRMFQTAFELDADVVNSVCWMKEEYSTTTFFEYALVDGMLKPQTIGEGMFTFGGIREFDMGGFGCTLINTRLFRKMSMPYFRLGYKATEFRDSYEYRYSATAGEDFYFYAKAHEAEAKLILDCGVLCDHYDILSDTFYPDQGIVELFTKSKDRRFHELDNRPEWFLLSEVEKNVEK